MKSTSISSLLRVDSGFSKIYATSSAPSNILPKRCDSQRNRGQTSLAFSRNLGISHRNQRPQNPHLTLQTNPLPYGCGSTRYNVCRFVGSNPAGHDRTPFPWACLCAWIDGTVCTLAADDFKTYRLPGAGADCDQDEAWTGECVHASASGDQNRRRLGV